MGRQGSNDPGSLGGVTAGKSLGGKQELSLVNGDGKAGESVLAQPWFRNRSGTAGGGTNRRTDRNQDGVNIGGAALSARGALLGKLVIPPRWWTLGGM